MTNVFSYKFEFSPCINQVNGRSLTGTPYTSCKSNSSQHTCRDLSTFFLLFHQLEIEINDNSICYYHFDECNHTHSNRPCSRNSSLGKGGARDLHILDEAIHQTTFTTLIK